MSMFSASSLYGGQPSPQPTPSGIPVHAANGQPEPVAKTVKGNSGAGFQNPVFLLVLLLAVAFGLIHFSVKVG